MSISWSDIAKHSSHLGDSQVIQSVVNFFPWSDMKRQRAKPVVPKCHKENDWQVESLNKYVFPSITWINWSSCLLHDKNQESIGNQCTSSVMFCSLCPLSVRQLIDRINLALTDHIQPECICWTWFKMILKRFPFVWQLFHHIFHWRKIPTKEWRRSLRKVHGFQLAILNHCPGFVRSYVHSTLAARIHRSDFFCHSYSSMP